jgi:hypothetical protein
VTVERQGRGKEMVCVVVEIRERTVVRRVRITAESIERAIGLCDGTARVISPIEPELFIAPKDSTGVSERRAEVAAGDCPKKPDEDKDDRGVAPRIISGGKASWARRPALSTRTRGEHG